MIGQHLIMRCAKGCYDNAGVAGLKTAAVSANVSGFPSPRQQELNKAISEHAAFPDVSVRSGSNDNRGVLRLFVYRGVLMAMRTFRVHDLCDTGGTVSFTHTYMIADDNSGEDKKYILAHPESLAELGCFDDYKKVAARTEGGLNSGNPIKVNDGLKMPDKELKKFDGSIFEKCGIDKETFAQIISAVCQHVSKDGWVALMTPNITEQTWEDHGGSPDGEKIIAAMMALLPDCITRFFTAVSYWNDNPVSDVMKDYKFRILSGKFSESLNDKSISLFDLQHGRINTEVKAGSFGRYLWDIKDNAEEIEKFHSFFTIAFGKNVDKIAKLPAIMDALTELYKFIDHKEINEQAALASLLGTVGTSLVGFPKIYQGSAMLIVSIKEKGGPCTEKLESVIVNILRNPDSAKLKVIYENLIALLYNSVKAGTAKAKTLELIVEKLDDHENEEYRIPFIECLEKLKADDKASPSGSMMSLLIDAEDVSMLHTQKEDIMAVVAKCYQNALDNKDYEVCAKMTAKQLRKDEPPENVTAICKRVVELTDFVTPETADELVLAIGLQMDKFEEYDETIVQMGKAIFGLEEECDIAAYPNFFPLFMKVLRHGLLVDREYIEGVWQKQLIFVIQNTNGDEYLFPEEFIGDPEKEGYPDALFIIEISRLLANVGYKSEWPVIDYVVNDLMQKDPQKAYENIQTILDCNDEQTRDELLVQIMGTTRIYSLFIALFSQDPTRSDYLLGYMMQDMNAFELIIEAAETDGFVDKLPDAYVYLWTAVYSAFASDPAMIESLWLGIEDTEGRIYEKPYCDKIMSQFAGYFTVVFHDITKIPEIKEDYIALLYRGIVDYGWDKVLDLAPQQTDIIEMCYCIDNGTPEFTIDYMIESIKQTIKSNGTQSPRAQNLSYCIKRINRYLNNNKRYIMEDRQSIDRDRVTMLSLARMYSLKQEGTDARAYLKSICDGDDHWVASLYILFGLKYMYYFESEDSPVIQSFLDTLLKIIRNASGAGRNTLISAECQDAYQNYIRPHLYKDQQDPLFKAARSTSNPDLMAMFEIEATKERPKGSGGFFGGRKKK